MASVGGRDYVVESRSVNHEGTFRPGPWEPISPYYYASHLSPWQVLAHCEDDFPSWKGKYEFRLRWLWRRPPPVVSV